MMTNIDPAEQTRRWLEHMVVGLNLCPFASGVINANSVHIEVCSAVATEDVLSAVLQQLDLLQRHDENMVATSLLVFSQGLQDFQAFWAIVEIAEELLQEVALDGVIQIASFHPQYLFEGEAVDDVSHYTNRSPFPMLHFIREAQLTRALADYPNADEIPQNNINRLQQLGLAGIEKILAKNAKP